MGRYRLPIYKWDTEGKLVAHYSGLKETIRHERMWQLKLYDALRDGILFHGHFWTRTATPPVIHGNRIEVVQEEDTVTSGQPWERDGFFDIKGWAAVMKIDAHCDDRRSIAIHGDRHLPKKYAGRRA